MKQAMPKTIQLRTQIIQPVEVAHRTRNPKSTNITPIIKALPLKVSALIIAQMPSRNEIPMPIAT
jgi:hypothetical protein